MDRSRLALLPIAALLVAACSSGGGTSSPAASSAAAQTRIEVDLADTLRFEPGSMTVPAGVPVTFVVTNGGVLDHEFYLGDEGMQAHHEEEMLEMGGMGHDEPGGIAVDPGETKELTYTFEKPGMTLVGCHVAGHYAGGMKATIAVVE
ncbi:MAG TPA: plastocyanin/azurin family copper-binding protein [Candidatus Limnocylindrales bacterium]|nr:plastocyanin/azurin family copper-binding protein [Candidatus Limnocylindrales bacterium]